MSGNVGKAACLPVSLAVAVAESGSGIGIEGRLPWRLRNELRVFKLLTSTAREEGKKNAVIMGRKTWTSIPAKMRPLEGRVNVVLSTRAADKSGAEAVRKELDIPKEVDIFASLDAALKELSARPDVERAIVIGGASVYAEALAHEACDSVFLTRVYGDFKCDTFFPEIDEAVFRCAGHPDLAPQGRQEEDGIQYEFLHFVRKASEADVDPAAEASDRRRSTSPEPAAATTDSPEAETEAPFTENARPPIAHPVTKRSSCHEELQYLDMVRYVLEHGDDRGDRTGTGTLSTFGTTMRFSLRNDTIPLLTTKRVFWRGVAEELLWFMSGDTSAKTLQEKNIHIWDGNGSREYLDKIGLTDREEGDLGPVYGFQWRHFGADYTTMHDDYSGKGVDQLAQLVHTIKTNPNDRRMILSAWNPAAFHLMALPPCHMFAQFYVSKGELSCQMYQRSGDIGLGVPFNIASYALLTHLLAKCTGLRAGEFIHVIGDCHIYKNHVEPLKEQLLRDPRPFPTLKINTDNTDIDGFKYEDLELVGYKPHKTIKMEMSV
ncbi:Bifunctional dihydrofolate reductase-thymidylate synthase [Hondaea fermentalgiana]|uniref:Bifunctional dihydrofolate reductase-thymidylate synthase n=1 Tax=Hondaea fermentalgiana TaxID=2315210 RepID=A0A2R5GPL8_9STRA|nr:Bifunctional dihydrofolate reductase-thymidylate synthase [Hondaea fermentalgiana]|eukprot:GBG32822.1 Bifunctional dihydrofolate reductase-thymidylate synthase [Hondaea fermentalgiana]